MVASGIRIGTPALTTRGMKEKEMMKIADLIDKAVSSREDEKALAEVRKSVGEITKKVPLYKSLLK